MNERRGVMIMIMCVDGRTYVELRRIISFQFSDLATYTAYVCMYAWPQ